MSDTLTTHKSASHIVGGRYKAALIDNERYLLTCYLYIELNPVHANMVELAHSREYLWSSHLCHAQGKIDQLIADRAVRFLRARK